MRLKSNIYRILIPLLLAVLIAGIAGGCGSDDPTELTQEDLEKILDEAVTATSEADSFVMNMTMNMDGAVTGEEASTLSAEMTGNGAFDTANGAMKMAMKLSFNLNMGFIDFSMDDVEIEAYELDGWRYQRMAVPDMDIGDEWTKMPVTDDDADMTDPAYMKDQIDFLKSSAELRLLRMENIDGVNCYVIEVTPDAEKIAGWISAQSMLAGDSMMAGQIPDTDLEQLEKLMENVDINVWVAKDDDYLMRFAVNARIDTSEFEGTIDPAPSDAGMPIMYDGDVVMDIDVTVTMTDYNKDVDITLPPEAANAEETSPEDIFDNFMGGGDPLDMEGFEGMFDGEFDPDEFSDMFGDGELDMEMFKEMFGDMDMDEITEFLEDENLDLEEIAKLLKDLDISFEEH